MFSSTYKSLLPRDRFADPLFSSAYESLFLQLVYFHIYTKPRGGGGQASSLRALLK